ncbi:hypothetical protein, partial [Streptomyces sp. NPDC005167]
MISKKAREAAAVLTPGSAPVRRKRVNGAMTGLAVAAALAAAAVPAAAQGQESHGAASGRSSCSTSSSARTGRSTTRPRAV